MCIKKLVWEEHERVNFTSLAQEHEAVEMITDVAFFHR